MKDMKTIETKDMITANVAWLLLFWIEGLRSGVFEQIMGYMQGMSSIDNHRFCCLGVGECIMNETPIEIYNPIRNLTYIACGYPPDHGVTNLLRVEFTRRTGQSLDIMNDSGRYSFNDIADELFKAFTPDLEYHFGKM